MEVLVIFVLGFVTGFASMVSVTIFLGKRALARHDKPKSITDRMKRVKEITNEQLNHQSGISGPQKNAMHGKHKNGLMNVVKELEDEKIEILTSIIKDGFDPEVSVLDEAGVVTTVKLSEFLANQGVVVPADEPPQPPVSDQKTKQVGKFTVYKGGKDDSGNTTH